MLLEIDVDEDEGTSPELHLLERYVEGMSNREYHAHMGVSSTTFSFMRKSMKLFENRHHFRADKPSYIAGDLIHTSILEPHLLNKYVEAPTTGLDTVEAMKLKKLHPHKTIVGKGMIEQALEMSNKVHLIYGDWIKPAIKEVSFFHKDEDSGLTFKCRPDIWHKDSGIVIDLKSSKEDDPREFAKTIEKFDYDLSSAWYCDVMESAGYPVTQFGWIVVPKTAPHAPYAFQATEELIEKGRAKYQTLLAKYIEYKNTGVDQLFKEAHSYEFIMSQRGY